MTDSSELALPQDFAERAASIRWLVCDVDGVLSDRLWYGPEGEQQKPFDPKDGLALRAASIAGLKVAILSARGAPALERRIEDLRLDDAMLGRSNKAEALEAFFERHQTSAEEIAAIGDDLPDLGMLASASLSFAPADAARDVRERVDVVLGQRGGQGAVREMVELLLRTRGDWQKVLDRYLAGTGPASPGQAG